MRHSLIMKYLVTYKHIYTFSLVGIFFILDRYFKWLAPQIESIGTSFFGFEYFENRGIAFSLPVPQMITITITPIIIILFLIHVQKHPTLMKWLGWFSLSIGALSNAMDRLLFGFVIDYIRIGTGVVNIADILIIIGVILYWVEHKKT